jgi:1-carboxybiuret hydrolase subunit AtzG-like protein
VIEDADVVRAAGVLKLNLSDRQIPAVTAQLRRIEEIALTLEAAELDPFIDEMAPVWRP